MRRRQAMLAVAPALLAIVAGCAALTAAVSSGTVAFGTQAGAMVGHLAGGNTAAAGKARTAAVASLGDLAGRLRVAARPATYAPVLDAADVSARRLEALAADPTLFAGVKTRADLPELINRVSVSVVPLAGACS